MSSRNDFAAYSVAHRLKQDEFRHLSTADRRRLVRLMARISEKSYRRGFQHGVEIGGRRVIEPSTLRHERSLDTSPYTDSKHGGHSAIERLFMECGVLRDLGFDEPEAAAPVARLGEPAGE